MSARLIIEEIKNNLTVIMSSALQANAQRSDSRFQTMQKDASGLQEQAQPQMPSMHKKEYNEIQKNFKGIFDQSMVNTNPEYSIVDRIKKVPELQAAQTSQRFRETGQLSGSGTKYNSGMQTKKTFAAVGKETFRNLGLKMNNTSGLDGGNETYQQSGPIEKSPKYSDAQVWGPPIHHIESGPLGYPMQPCNQEIMAAQYAQMMANSPSSQYNFQDFMQKNIGDLKTFKSKTLMEVKQRIEFIHAKLRSKNNLGVDLLELQAIEQHLPVHLRTSFIQLPHHAPILKDLQDLNSCFVPVLDFLCSYKTEFGVMLQRMIESYNILLLMQFEGFYKTDNSTKQEYEQKLLELDQKMKDVDHQLGEFATQKEMAQGLIRGKDKIIESLTERNEFLEKLQQDLTQEVMDGRAEKHKKEELLKEKAKRVEESKKIQNDSDMSGDDKSGSGSSSSELESDSASASGVSLTESQCAKRDLDEFAQAISDSNQVISDRTQFMHGLNRIVQKALKKGYAETFVQTVPIEMGGQLGDDGEVESMGATGMDKANSDKNTTRNSGFENQKKGAQMANDQIIIEENLPAGSINNMTKSTFNDPRNRASEIQGDNPGMVNTIMPFENSNSTHGKSAIQMGKIDPVTISMLNKRLIGLLQKPIKGSLAKQQQENKIALDMGKYTWSNPQFVLLFLKPAIERYTVPVGESGKPPQAIKINIAAWDTFKKQIYEIYDHRIQHAPEIQGTVNSTYMSLDEHLLCYFLEKNYTRVKVENALIEFLATLKYYSETWDRAKMYAQLSGFMQFNETFLRIEDTTGTGLRLNDGEIEETDVPIIDMYLQEFFLHGYAYLKKEQRSFVESKEGFTYIRLQNEERISSKLLTFNQSIEKQGKWTTKIRQNIKKIKQNPLDDFDTDFIDIDTLQNLYIAEFREAKKAIQTELISKFNMVVQANKERNALSTQSGLQIIKEVTKKNNVQQPAVSFAGSISAMRGMLYAFMCSTNGEDVNDFEFLAGCNRFAVDNPLPTVTKRIAYYGNHDDIAKQLDAFAAKLQDPAVIEVGQYTSVNVAMDRRGNHMSLDPAAANAMVKDLGETQITEPKKRQKFAAVKDLTMLSRCTDGKEYEAPADQIRTRGVILKVKDINSTLQKKTELNKQGIAPDRSFRMTSLEVGIQGEKQLIVPSFGMTSSLFTRHCEILRLLRRRIQLLKQAYQFQLDENRSWLQVDQIIEVLDRGITFLGFDDVVGDKHADGLPLMYEDPLMDEDEALALNVNQNNFLKDAADRLMAPNIDEGSLNNRSEMAASRMSAQSDKKSSKAGGDDQSQRPDSKMRMSVDAVSKNDE